MAPPLVDEQTVSMKQKLLALIALSSTGTLVGIFSKVSQVSGKYHFSPASAVVCTEFFKLIISLIMIVRLMLRGELVDRKAPPVGATTDAARGGSSTKTSALSGHRTEKEDNDVLLVVSNKIDYEEGENDMDVELGVVGDSKALLESKSHTKNNVEELTGREKKRGGGGVYEQYKADLVEFWRVNFSVPLVCHQFGLAAAYCVVNIVTYAIFIHASGSMFFLLKASSPVVTAVLLWAMVNRRISRPQWIAVTLQCFGLLGTQLNPCAAALAAGGGGVASSAAAAMSVTGYVLILINVVVSCAAGVWNEHIIKNFGTSVNFQNSLLYTFGVIINLMLFWFAPPRMVGAATDSQLGFFEGYNLSVFGIIMANGSVGLVITMVYKYADVVVKTFGLAGSTITLFLLEIMGLIPGGRVMPLSTSLTGAAAVFYASYIYILPPKEFAPPTASEKKVASSSTAAVVGGGAAVGGGGTVAEEGATKTVIKNTSSLFLNNGGGDEGGGAAVTSGAALLTASTTSMPDEAPAAAAFDVMTLSWRSSLANKKIKTLLAIGSSVIFAFVSAAMACSLGMN